MAVKKLSTKNFLQQKTLASYDIKSFVDLRLKTNKTINLNASSPTGLDPATTYTTALSIGGNAISVSIIGTSLTTIAGLTSALNTAVSSYATASFIADESVIRILASASGSTALSVTTIGTLPSAIKGDKIESITTEYGLACVGGGVNFILSNVASSDNPVYAPHVAQATTSAGADIGITHVYDTTTGILQVKKASGSFSVGDSIVVIGNLY
jgi:hypothetical protein